MVKLVLIGVLLIFMCGLTVEVRTDDSFTERAHIRRVVQSTMRCRKIPGLTLAVVHDNQTQMAEAFGYRELFLPDNDTRGLAENDTRFCIGSISKAFTATLIAQLLHENHQAGGNVTWDTRLTDPTLFGPNWRLSGEFRTKHVTIKDILSHKVGWSQFVGAWVSGWDDTRSRTDYCSRLYYITATFDFRQRFYYSNFGYILAGCVVEKLANKGFRQVIKEKIFDPLGMNDTEFPMNYSDWSKYALAYAYYRKNESFIQLDRIHVSNQVPAEPSGGICTTAADMAKWILLHLNNGKKGAEQIVDADFLRETRTRQVSNEGKDYNIPKWPVATSDSSYGMGWMIGHYRGYRRLHHTGGLSGYGSYLSFFPDMKFGIFTSANGPQGTGGMFNGMEALHFYISDILLGYNKTWLNNDTLCTYPEPWQSRDTTLEVEHANIQKPQDGLSLSAKSKVEKSNESSREFLGRSYKNLVNLIPEEYLQEDPIEQSNQPWYEPYVGVYGHRFFGNMTCVYDTSAGALYGRAGKWGEAYLERSNTSDPFLRDRLFWMHLTGAAWYMQNTGATYVDLPVLFVEKQGNVYNGILNIPYQWSNPPIFRRGVKWSDPDPPPPWQHRCPERPCPTPPGGAGTMAVGLSTMIICFLVTLLVNRSYIT